MAAPVFLVASLKKKAILSKDSLPNSQENIDFDLYGIDFPETDEDGNVIMTDDEITLLYALTAAVTANTTNALRIVPQGVDHITVLF